MRMVRVSSTDYYSQREALRAAEQLIELLQQEHDRGFFTLDNVTLQAEDASLVFTGAEYLAFARRGIQEAIVMAGPRKDGPKPGEE
jgi:hypothetical protein